MMQLNYRNIYLMDFVIYTLLFGISLMIRYRGILYSYHNFYEINSQSYTFKNQENIRIEVQTY